MPFGQDKGQKLPASLYCNFTAVIGMGLGAMGHSPIFSTENGPLTNEIGISNIERMANSNFQFMCKIWKMARFAHSNHCYRDVVHIKILDGQVQH